MSSADESVAAALRARPEVLRGILLMCAGVSMFPFMNAAVKLLTAGYPVSPDRLGAVHRAPGDHADRVPAAIRPRAARDPAAGGADSPLSADAGQQHGLRHRHQPRCRSPRASAIGFTSPLLVTALSVPLLHEKRRLAAVERRPRRVRRGAAGDPARRPGFTIRRCCCCCSRRAPTRCTRSRPAGSASMTAPRPASCFPPCWVRWVMSTGAAVRVRLAARYRSTGCCSAVSGCSAAPGITW